MFDQVDLFSPGRPKKSMILGIILIGLTTIHAVLTILYGTALLLSKPPLSWDWDPYSFIIYLLGFLCIVNTVNYLRFLHLAVLLARRVKWFDDCTLYEIGQNEAVTWAVLIFVFLGHSTICVFEKCSIPCELPDFVQLNASEAVSSSQNSSSTYFTTEFAAWKHGIWYSVVGYAAIVLVVYWWRVFDTASKLPRFQYEDLQRFLAKCVDNVDRCASESATIVAVHVVSPKVPVGVAALISTVKVILVCLAHTFGIETPFDMTDYALCPDLIFYFCCAVLWLPSVRPVKFDFEGQRQRGHWTAVLWTYLLIGTAWFVTCWDLSFLTEHWPKGTEFGWNTAGVVIVTADDVRNCGRALLTDGEAAMGYLWIVAIELAVFTRLFVCVGFLAYHVWPTWKIRIPTVVPLLKPWITCHIPYRLEDNLDDGFEDLENGGVTLVHWAQQLREDMDAFSHALRNRLKPFVRTDYAVAKTGETV